jgi:hypothetical protein
MPWSVFASSGKAIDTWRQLSVGKKQVHVRFSAKFNDSIYVQCFPRELALRPTNIPRSFPWLRPGTQLIVLVERPVPVQRTTLNPLKNVRTNWPDLWN